MAKERKLRGKARRASYFIRTASGEFIYQGPLYAPASKGRVSPERIWLLRWGMGVVIGLLWIADGCVPVHGMVNTFYVILPYGIGLICAAMLLWAVIQMGLRPAPLREYVYEATVKKLPVRTLAVAICAGLTAIGEAVSLLLEGGGGSAPGMTAFFLLSQGVVLALAALWFRLERGFDWEKQT